jgi:RimJ/RimL family protein N-acetyltransferase
MQSTTGARQRGERILRMASGTRCYGHRSSNDYAVPVPFEVQPVLKGPLVTLRPLEPADHDRLYAVAADPLIWEQHPDKTRSQPAGFRNFFQQALDSGGALIALETGSARVIGSSRYHGYDEAADEVEIGWTFLARSHWGGRYNGEMKRLMLQHAFRFVGRVVFLIDPANLRSQRAVEKLGAVRIGMRTDGSGRPSCVFQLRAEDWAADTSSRTQ